MPISKKEFEKSQQPLDIRILSFLQENSDKAYDEIEIYAAIMGYSENSLMIAFLGADQQKLSSLLGPLRKELENLQKEDKIRSAVHRGATYYSISDK